jgi:hypothetical protein
MQMRIGNDIVILRGHRCFSWALTLLCVACIGLACKVHAQQHASAPDNVASTAAPPRCLPSGDGYLKARLTGNLATELDWGNDGMDCTGAVRPTDGGIRMRFSRHDPVAGTRLVVVFGIAKLQEGQSARGLPVNVTLIREGAGEFYSTQGDDKCMLDRVEQQPITGIPHRSRSYRIVARGYCTEPARSVRGKGSILVSRFDYAGRVDFGTEDEDTDTVIARKL